MDIEEQKMGKDYKRKDKSRKCRKVGKRYRVPGRFLNFINI